nr:gallate 1-beta-glucosyltransferase-like [Tanacetum cinerariifolium]
METFQELEEDLIKYMSTICPIRPVGPMFKNPLLETISNISGDMKKADYCLKWLDSKNPCLVVYISFGTLVSFSQEQMSELAYGIWNSGLSFLWALRKGATFTGESGTLPKEFLESMGDKGMIVEWSPQAEVLSHPAVSCFVSHCGWNSTLEALSSGVPVVAFPGGQTESKVIGRREVEICLREATSGVTAAEMKMNALKWKELAEEAVAEGGSSIRNIQEFVDEVMTMS